MGPLRKFGLQSLSVLLLLPSSLLAAIIRVPQSYPTIQAGINAALNGDTVLVSPGTYFENVNFNGKSIVLKSVAGPELTILRGGGPIIKLISGEDTTSIIDGFTFKLGWAANGGGILFNNSSGTVINNIFDSCSATGGSSGNGGAIACMGALSRVRISNNVIKNGLGGGERGQADAIFCLGSTVEISRNLITDNSSVAVIFAYTNSNVKLINNTIANTPGNTGAYALLCLDVTAVDVRNNVFFNNPQAGIINLAGNRVKVEYNDFYSSPAQTTLGPGNISQNPLFVGGDPYSYSLQEGSPCIDAGDPATPVPSFGGSRVDMGAFEFEKGIGLYTPRTATTLKKNQFIWASLRDSDGAVVPASYRAVIALGCDFSVGDSSPVVRDTVWKFPYKLMVGPDYCWKVIVVPDAGDTTIITDSVRFVVINPLLTPILPANNSTLKVRRPSFTWNSISDTSIPESFSYRVVFSTDSSFGAAESSSVVSGTAWKAERSLAIGQPYFWKVAASGSDLDTVTSGARRFSLVNPSLAPVLPPNNSTLKIRRPTFSWNSVGDTSIPELFSYQVLFSTDNGFGVAETSAVVTDTVWKMDRSLVVGQSYYWKIIAVGDSGDTIISPSSKFMIVGSFNLYLPAANSFLKLRRPTFIWQSVYDTSTGELPTYRVILSKDSNFNVTEISPPLADTAWKVDHVLDANQAYYWRTIAIFPSGDTAFSNAAIFTVSAIPFAVYSPLSAVHIKQPTFVWRNVVDTSITGSYTYRIILSKSVDFALAETSTILTDTVWKVPHKLELYTIYYWKVESILNGANSTFNNAVFVEVQPPPIFPLLPLEATNARQRQPTLVWSTVRDTSIPDTFLYQVRISKEDFSSEILSPIQSDTSWPVSSPLQAGTIYVWTPMAFYSNDNDTIKPEHSSFFRELPTRVIIPDDRPRIQEGIDLVLNGDTVWVKPGVYYENIFFKGKKVKVISEKGPESTTIAKYVDGLELVNFSSDEDNTTLLQGFMITGATQVSNGAAIKVVNASPRIENNHIVGNWGDAGAIWILNGFPHIERNLMEHNTGASAILFSGVSGAEIINCTISNNQGDGIRLTPGVPIQVTNSIISFNAGYGIRSTNGSNLTSTIAYDDVFGNTLGHFFAILPSGGMINADPSFADGNPYSYHLSNTSPCIDAGDPASPVPAGGGSRIDMGAFEFTLTKGDLNGDGSYGPVDVVLEMNCAFLGSGNCNLAMTDLDCDGQLSTGDVVLILNFVFLGSPLPC